MEKKIYIAPQTKVFTMAFHSLLSESLNMDGDHHVTDGNHVFSRDSNDWDEDGEE